MSLTIFREDQPVASGGDTGFSERHMLRWRERYFEEGYNGLLDRRRGKPSRRRVRVATVESREGLTHSTVSLSRSL
jgi:hypothetical protein